MIEQFYSTPKTIARLRSTPLGDYIDRFAEELCNQGYSPHVLPEKIRTVGELGHWLSCEQIDLAALNEEYIEEFLGSCRQKHTPYVQPHALRQFLCYLREIGVAPEARPKLADTRKPIEKEYEDYLVTERGIAAPTIRYNLFTARRFLTERFGNEAFDCSQLRAADVTEFTLRHAYTYKLSSARTMLASLRVFLRFLHMREKTPRDLSGCVFRVANWRLANLPTFLEPRQVEQLLDSAWRTRSGLRDYAILLLLARLGLRGGEVVNLQLADIDWTAGTITVRGKGKQDNRLPIPHDVGEAVVKYLRHGRPRCSCRKVFLRAMAPVGPLLTSGAITSIVGYHLTRAGLSPPKKGAHVLRHSLATRMIRGGNTLDEIADILGHQFHTSTEIYAKVAVEPLRKLAQPWPGVRP